MPPHRLIFVIHISCNDLFLLKLILRSCRVAEAVVRSCSVKRVFLRTSQNLQGNTCFFFNKASACDVI